MAYCCHFHSSTCACSRSAQVSFDVTLSKGVTDTFVMEVHPDWAPLGAARFKEMLDSNFFKSTRFFRTIPGFMSQVSRPITADSIAGHTN
jgi:cyclophilin family peptidyl-prolyl cis-trans isomerase